MGSVGGVVDEAATEDATTEIPIEIENVDPTGVSAGGEARMKFFLKKPMWRGIPVQTSVPALPDPKATLAVMAFLVSMVKMEDQGPKDPLDHQAKQDHRDSLAW